MSLIIQEAVFLDTVMRSFVKSIHNINIKKIADQSQIFVTRLFFILYVIVKEAQCIKDKVKKGKMVNLVLTKALG